MKQILKILGSAIATAILVLSWPSVALSEDGYDLWLRYHPVSGEWLGRYRAEVTELVSGSPSPTLEVAGAELVRGLSGLLDTQLPVWRQPTRDGSVIFGTARSSALIAGLGLPLERTGAEGYLIRDLRYEGHRVSVIAANSDAGVLHGVFHFLRLIQTRQSLQGVDILSVPRISHRILNHWDNLDRTVERGYAGESIFDWQKLPDYLDPRYVDYARACASLGINGVAPTNVNASPIGLRSDYLRKYAALAQVFRPYGLRLYLTARFSAPIELGGLKSADPLDPAVRRWWRDRVEEIYALIPDFGGFLIKANSEGQPGPQDYSRTHADGANMLADLVAPHGGIVIWRAFVYSQHQGEDRAKQGYAEFKPLDGRFRDNVAVQVKNGPIDFQPREPFHPLFGAMPHTSLMLEVQLTKEYLGFATHLAYLGTLFEETLRSDTRARGKDSTVSKVIDGSLSHAPLAGIAGVANIGSDRNWTGSQFDQANWYAFGRLAWDPGLSARDVATEWLKMTFSNDPLFVTPVLEMMMSSREAVVDYMTPLGLHHQMARENHYGPGPWVDGGPRADWTSVYFNRADSQGIGFDRTATGSNAVAQYSPDVAAVFGNVRRTPDTLLLWFHHLPWNYRMASGRSLWDELVIHYSRGVQSVTNMRGTWSGVSPYVDAERFQQTAQFLAIQEKEARWWRDASIAYFQSLSHRPLPAGYAPPEHELQYYKQLCFPYAPGHPPLPVSGCP